MALHNSFRRDSLRQYLGADFNGSSGQRRVYKRLMTGEFGSLRTVLDKVPVENMEFRVDNLQIWRSVIEVVPIDLPEPYRVVNPWATVVELSDPVVKSLEITTDAERVTISSLAVVARDTDQWKRFWFEQNDPYITVEDNDQPPIGRYYPGGELLEESYDLTEAVADARVLRLPE